MSVKLADLLDEGVGRARADRGAVRRRAWWRARRRSRLPRGIVDAGRGAPPRGGLAAPPSPPTSGPHPGSAPTVKQHLAAIRMLCDWLVVSQVLPVNPAAAVRGPKHVVTKGATPVLSPAEARNLLESIDTGTLAELRDRALLSVMLYSFPQGQREAPAARRADERLRPRRPSGRQRTLPARQVAGSGRRRARRPRQGGRRLRGR